MDAAQSAGLAAPSAGLFEGLFSAGEFVVFKFGGD